MATKQRNTVRRPIGALTALALLVAAAWTGAAGAWPADEAEARGAQAAPAAGSGAAGGRSTTDAAGGDAEAPEGGSGRLAGTHESTLDGVAARPGPVIVSATGVQGDGNCLHATAEAPTLFQGGWFVAEWEASNPTMGRFEVRVAVRDEAGFEEVGRSGPGTSPLRFEVPETALAAGQTLLVFAQPAEDVWATPEQALTVSYDIAYEAEAEPLVPGAAMCFAS